MGNLLVYKNIIFDDFTVDENGIWAELCDNHAQEYKSILSNELDDGYTAIGYCSVKGCEKTGENSEFPHYYIDFSTNGFEYIIDIDSNNDYISLIKNTMRILPCGNHFSIRMGNHHITIFHDKNSEYFWDLFCMENNEIYRHDLGVGFNILLNILEDVIREHVLQLIK